MSIERKVIFDAVREIEPEFWNRPGAVARMDRAIDRATGTITVTAPKQPEEAEPSEFARAVIDHLRFEEGVRNRAYRDHLGYWTIGIGRLIDARKGGRITPEEDAILIANDPRRRGKPWREYVLTDAEMNMLKRNDIERFVGVISKWPAWKAAGDNVARKVALTSLAFQLGTAGLAGFKNSLRMIEEGRFADAADNFMKSRWAKQTPARARRVTDMIRTGRLA